MTANRENVKTNSTTEMEFMLGCGESFGEEILLGIKECYEYTTEVIETTKFQLLLEEEFLHLFSTMPTILDRMRHNAFELHPNWKKPTGLPVGPSAQKRGSFLTSHTHHRDSFKHRQQHSPLAPSMQGARRH